MTSLIISIANSLGQSIAGLEKVWLCRNHFCQAKGLRHVLLVQLGDDAEYPADYLTQFGTVVFLGREGQPKSRIDLAMRDYFLEQVNRLGKENLVVINDDPHYRMPKAWHFLTGTGVRFHHFIHYDPLEKGYGDALHFLNRQADYFVCNEKIAEGMLDLGFAHVRSLPAVYVTAERSLKNSYGNYSYCLVAGQNPVKRIDMALEAFQRLFEQGYRKPNLTIYGDLPDRVKARAKDMLNVTIGGTVSSVPYWAYDGFISCSVTEAFSNSAVEAAGYGLDLMLSRNRCHNLYLEMLQRSDSCFSSSDELVNLLVSRFKGETTPVDSAQLVEMYRFDAYCEIWEEIIEHL